MAKFSIEIKDKSKLESPVRLVINYNGHRFRYALNVSVKVSDWDFNKQKLKHSDKNSITNFKVENKVNVIKNYVLGLIEIPPPKELKYYIDDLFGKAPDRNDFFDYAKMYINKLKDQGKAFKGVKRTIDMIKEFEIKERYKIEFKTIDIKFYYLFLQYLKDYKTNYIGRKIKDIKMIMNSALSDQATNQIGHKHRDFKVLTNDVDTIYLNETEIDTMVKYYLSNQNTALFWFLVGCFTGLRVSGYKQFKLENINNNILNAFIEKTQSRVQIPLHPQLQKLIEFGIPKLISEQKIRDGIKLICKKLEFNEVIKYKEKYLNETIEKTAFKYELVSTHTARRSFATNLYLSGFPANSIMKITGHKTESEFLKYLRMSSTDTANQLAEFWSKH